MSSQPSNAPGVPLAPELEPEEEIDLSRWLEALQRRRRLLLSVAGAVVAAALLLYVITPKSYRAATTIQIERQAASVVSVDNLFGVESWADAQSFYPTQYKLLESRGLAERVVRDLRLAENPAFNPTRGRLLGNGAARPSTAEDDAAELSGLARRVQGGLGVKPIRNTRLVEISYVAHDPELAALVANGVAEAYIDWGVELRSETVGRASSFLASQIEELKQEIQDKESQLQAYSRRTDIVALDPNSNVVMQRLEALNRDYIQAVSARIDLEAKYNEVHRAPAETVADTFSGGLVAQLRQELLRQEQEYATQLNTYKPEWPAMQELKAKIDKGRQHVESVIAEMVEKARDSARTEYQTALRREQSLTAELARQKAEAMQLNSAAVEYNNLRVEVSTRRTLLDELLRKQSETGVANRLQGTRSSNVVVVDRALVPGGPYRPSLKRNLALGLVLGLMLGVGAVFLVELLDRTMRTPDDVDRVLGLPVLGVIPDISATAGAGYYGYHAHYGYGGGGEAEEGKKARRGKRKSASAPADKAPRIELIPHAHPRLAVSEAYRNLRTALLLSTPGGLRSVVVTSASAGEGKTVTATNLAVVLAQLGHQVLLVDADLRRPRLHQVFRVSNRKGLVSCLTGTVEPAEILLRTEVPGLHLTPSGPTPPNPAELLSARGARDFVALAANRFEYVVFDSPPVVPVTDATLLATLTDGVVLTVGAGRANRDDAAAAVERLAMANVRVLGTVLNLFHAERRRYGRYGRYGSYGYGYGYGAGPQGGEAPPAEGEAAGGGGAAAAR